MNQPLISLHGLKTHFSDDEGTTRALNGVTLDIFEGQAVGVVGESGCGKSVMARSMLRIEKPGRIVDGQIKLRRDGEDIDLAGVEADGRLMKEVRGGDIGLIFQEPMTSFSPVHSIGNQLAEAVTLHHGLDKRDAQDRAVDLLKMVDLPNPEKIMNYYAWQMSGGMRQRAMVAMALAGEPRLLIADEPTTALDVTGQAQILDLIRKLKDETGMALMLITHDLGVVAGMADYIVVMYLGEIVEQGPAEEIFYTPRHPYTRALLQSIPSIMKAPRTRLAAIAGSVPHPFNRPSGCPFHTRCTVAIEGVCDKEEPPLQVAGDGHSVRCHLPVDRELQAVTMEGPPLTVTEREEPLPEQDDRTILQVRDLRKFFPTHGTSLSRNRARLRAVDGVNFDLRAGETFALVGESGSGKTTTSRCILRALKPDVGEVLFRTDSGLVDLAKLTKKQVRPLRSQMQMIFQDPYSSLDPRMRVLDIVSEPLLVNGMGNRRERIERVRELLSLVGLPQEYMLRFPHAFSGGQRQRIGIARALALNPKLIVADEPVSALDVSVQAQILNLLLELQERLGLTYVFVSHDLSVVKHVSDRIAVMYGGQLVELGQRDEVLENPRHPYTSTLLAAIPKPDPRAKTAFVPPPSGSAPNLIDPPAGCYFASRCRYAIDRCKTEQPEWSDIGDGRRVRCHRSAEIELPGVGHAPTALTTAPER